MYTDQEGCVNERFPVFKHFMYYIFVGYSVTTGKFFKNDKNGRSSTL